MPSAATVHRLRITLRTTDPPVWRRVEVASSTTLADLHTVIQTAMGWEDSHLHEFETSRGRRLPDERRTRIGDLLPGRGSRLLHRYDLGDGWEHDVLVEAVSEGDPGVALPRCTGGSLACPPEDCGGPWGYGRIAAGIRDPSVLEDDERDEVEAILEEGFDPDWFDIEAVNAALGRSRLAVRPRRRSAPPAVTPDTTLLLPLPLGEAATPAVRDDRDDLHARLQAEVRRLLGGEALAGLDAPLLYDLEVLLAGSRKIQSYGLMVVAGTPEEAPAETLVTGLLLIPPGATTLPEAPDLRDLPPGAVLVAVGPAPDDGAALVVQGTRRGPAPPTLKGLRVATVAAAAAADVLSLGGERDPDAPAAGTVDLPGGVAMYQILDIGDAVDELFGDDADAVEIDLGPIPEPAASRQPRRRRS